MRLLISVALAATTLLPLSLTAPINPSSLPATTDNAPSSPEIERIVARAEAAEAAEAKKKKKKKPENAPMIMPPLPDDNTPYPPWLGQPGTPAYDFPGSRGSKGHWTMPAQPVDDPDEPGLVWFVDEKRDLSSNDGVKVKSIDPPQMAKSETPAAAEVEGRDASPSPPGHDWLLLGPGCIETPYGPWCPGDGPLPCAVGTGSVSEKVDRRDAAVIPPVSTDADPTFENLPAQPAPLVLRRDDTASPSKPYTYKAGSDFLPCIAKYHGKIHEGELHDNGDCVIEIAQKQINQAVEDDRGIVPDGVPHHKLDDLRAFGYVDEMGLWVPGSKPDPEGNGKADEVPTPAHLDRRDDTAASISSSVDARAGYGSCRARWEFEVYDGKLLDNGKCLIRVPSPDGSGKIPFQAEEEDIVSKYGYENAAHLKLRNAAGHGPCKARHAGEVYDGKLQDNGKCEIWISPPDGFGSIVPFDAEDKDIIRAYGPDGTPHHKLKNAAVYGFVDEKGHWHSHRPSTPNPGPVKPASDAAVQPRNAPDSSEGRRPHGHNPAAGTCFAMVNGERQKGHMRGNGNCAVVVQDAMGDWQISEIGDKDITDILDMDGNWHRHAKHATFPWQDKNGRWHIHPHPRLSEREVEPEDGWIDPADVPVLAPGEIYDDGIPMHF